MKKVITCFLMCLCLFGCKKDTVKYELSKGTMPTIENSGYMYKEANLLSYELETTDEYDSKVENKDSFLLFIYSPSCTGCKNVAPSISEYVDNNQVAIYTLDKANISSKHSLYKAGVTTTPYFIIVFEGEIKVVKFIDNVGLNKEQNKQLVNDFMSKNIEWRK